ncbi:hypothetical protein Mapa_016696 [Marchantia paleacea]|nr:hypothetical protein Mapa_016696 [Marchantia paleacea]
MASKTERATTNVQGKDLDVVADNGKLEKIFTVPEFKYSYTNYPMHPLTQKYTDEAHAWYSSYGIESQISAEQWNKIVNENIPHICGFVFSDRDSEEMLYLCKYILYFFVLDFFMDEGESSSEPDQCCEIVLESTLILLWPNPEHKRLLDHLEPLYDAITTEESRSLVSKFHAELLHAKNKTKSLMDVELTPLSSALRDLWAQYRKIVPAEFVLREAEVLQDYIMGCLHDVHSKKKKTLPTNINDYIVLRRDSVGLLPLVVCSDLTVAKRGLPHIPNALYYGPEMQNLLMAIGDVVAWHNDIYSFRKEVIQLDCQPNLVRLLFKLHNCASYTEAAHIALKLVQDRIVEMEIYYEQVKAIASTEFHPAIDIWITTIRKWVSGTHQWHLQTSRYMLATPV